MLSNHSSEPQEPLSRKNRGLLALVIFLGILIIVATTVLVFVIIGRIMHKKDNSANVPFSQMISQPVDGTIQVSRPVSVLQEPEGTRIVSVLRQSDQILVISLSGGGADRLVVWDIGQQKKLEEIRLPEHAVSSSQQAVHPLEKK